MMRSFRSTVRRCAPWLCLIAMGINAWADPAVEKKKGRSETRLPVATDTATVGETVEDPFQVTEPVHDRSLAAQVRRANEELRQKYSVLDPKLLTVAGVRQAIHTEMTKLAKSTKTEKYAIVETLQGILDTGRLPKNVEFHIMPITARHKPGSPHFGTKTISLNYTLIVPTPRGRSDAHAVGLRDLHEAFCVLKGDVQQRLVESLATDVPSGGTAIATGQPLLEPGTWWNLYFAEGHSPLRDRPPRVHAVKVVGGDDRRPSWIQIAFPADAREHLSIIGAAAKAHNAEELPPGSALEQWETSITEWRVEWINLDYVVRMTSLSPAQSSTARKPPLDPQSLAGDWVVQLPLGYTHSATITLEEGERLSLTSGGSVFNGVYRWQDGRLSVVEPNDARMLNLVWTWDRGQLRLTSEPEGTPTGASYLGTTLTRAKPSTN